MTLDAQPKYKNQYLNEIGRISPTAKTPLIKVFNKAEIDQKALWLLSPSDPTKKQRTIKVSKKLVLYTTKDKSFHQRQMSDHAAMLSTYINTKKTLVAVHTR